MVLCTCNPSTCKAETEGLQVLQSELLVKQRVMVDEARVASWDNLFALVSLLSFTSVCQAFEIFLCNFVAECFPEDIQTRNYFLGNDLGKGVNRKVRDQMIW